MDRLVLAVSDNDGSKAQLKDCRTEKPLIHGVVECHRTQKEEERKFCAALRSFPAWCDKDTNVCSFAPEACSADSLSSLVRNMRTRNQSPNR